MILLRAIAALALMLSAGQAGDPASVSAAAKPAETQFYPAAANGTAVLNAALLDAKTSGKPAVIVFGADWCHDSRALAKVLASDAFKAEFGARYTVTLIDVGKPQTGAGRNLDLVKQLGVKNLKSTPALFVISPDGKLLNGPKDAVSWRNADSRGNPAMLAWFRSFSKK